MTKDIELFKFTRLYLGQKNWELLKATTKEELALMQKYPIDLKKSYLVYGSQSMLEKFRAFYLTRCIKERPLYSQYPMSDYADELSSGTKDEYGLNVDQDLIFLYQHNHISSLGNSEKWLNETIINKIAIRNREGLITVILSEVALPMIKNSGEVELINLNKRPTRNIKIVKQSSNDEADFDLYS